MLISGSPSIAVACLASVVLSNVAQAAAAPNKWASIKYSTVVGLFAQDLPETNDSSFDYVCGDLYKYDDMEPTDWLSNGRFQAILVSWIIFN